MSPVSGMIPTPEDRDALAGEYVLGLIERVDRERFEQRLDNDSDLSLAVARWQARLAPIDATAPAIPPSPALWPAIEAAIAMAAQPGRRPAAQTRSRFAGWWESLPVWRGAALAGAFATLLLAAGLIGALDRARRQPVMIAVLLTDTSVAAAVVNTFADGRVEMVPLQNIAVPEGKALEIWTLWDRAVGPRSVGLIDRARSTPLRLDQLPLGRDQLFEITLEPSTGSPTGRPTGPVIAKGTTAQAL
ncbi:anti-sigma factor [Bosea sp. NBC_00550]|uniref:anti-sigma factor n=1 Tax=Bosea sp. NBC_00550 TaxID=2969621 RepID=UPI002230AA6E|nr:anti-sigma factor [Bosea sp. NBC_00550]UZF94633.1 anti-sigma factor [Bosea sp. NBC_00550]